MSLIACFETLGEVVTQNRAKHGGFSPLICHHFVTTLVHGVVWGVNGRGLRSRNPLKIKMVRAKGLEPSRGCPH